MPGLSSYYRTASRSNSRYFPRFCFAALFFISKLNLLKRRILPKPIEQGLKYMFQASTFALVVLRICNMLTIFNLLVFTTNEFIVIRYPLHYRRYFRRKAVLAILSCWSVGFFKKSDEDSVPYDVGYSDGEIQQMLHHLSPTPVSG